MGGRVKRWATKWNRERILNNSGLLNRSEASAKHCGEDWTGAHARGESTRVGDAAHGA